MALPKSNYRQIEGKLATLTPFIGNSSYGIEYTDGSYSVFSYSTLIATRYPDGRTELAPKIYSQTTSRLQNLVAKAWGLN